MNGEFPRFLQKKRHPAQALLNALQKATPDEIAKAKREATAIEAKWAAESVKAQ